MMESENRNNALDAVEGFASCSSVDHYEYIGKIGQGTYGVVSRARDKRTGEIVALKRIKFNNPQMSREGFPLTALREINALMQMHQHENIVHVKEVVIGSDLNKVFVVMDYAEHTLRDLIEQMRQRFTPAEVKCLMLQLLDGVRFMHDEQWIIHRDIKTSNLLMTNRGTLKICDFGMARTFGSPLRRMTPNVITLWYRAPEMLLGQEYYTTAVDMWSVGCIFYELLTKTPLFTGQSEIEQIQTIFRELGTPNESRWEGWSQLPAVKSFNFHGPIESRLHQRFSFEPSYRTDKISITNNCFDLLVGLLEYDPKRRLTAAQALEHPYFKESPAPKPREMMPTFPSAHEKTTSQRR